MSRYTHHERWRGRPCEGAVAEDSFGDGFGNRRSARPYQRRSKRQFPCEPWDTFDTENDDEVLGNTYARSR